MKSPMIFRVTNFLGFSHLVEVRCRTIQEGRRYLIYREEYPPKKIEFVAFNWDGKGKFDEKAYIQEPVVEKVVKE